MGRPSLARPSPLGPPALASRDAPGRTSPALRSPAFSADHAAAPLAGLKTEGETPPRRTRDEDIPRDEDIVEQALKALNMAAALIKKDRLDARTLGMESLVLLTDPLRAGADTAKIASRVVLLGSVHHDAGRAGDADDVDALFDESAGLGIRETILEMIMTDTVAEQNMAAEEEGSFIEKEFTDSLFNLCLTVLSNALTVIGEEPTARAAGAPPKKKQAGDEDGSDAGSARSRNPYVEDDDSSEADDDRKPSPSVSPNRRRAATEPCVRPLGVSRQFIDDTNATFGGDVLSSLIGILGQAKTNPHDAYHSARCLGVLFKGCGPSHKARARKELDAKSIIALALEVGCRSHAKLEDASRVAMMALVTDDEGSMVEEEEVATEVAQDTAGTEREATATGSERRTEHETTVTGIERLGEETDTEQQELEELPPVIEHSLSGDSDVR